MLDRNTQGEEHHDSVSSPCTAMYEPVPEAMLRPAGARGSRQTD